MTHPYRTLCVALCTLVVACGKQAAPADKSATSTPASTKESAHEHVHTDRQDLGELTLGAHKVRVFQVAPVTAGQEGDFDLDFEAGKALPTAAVRGWIGSEDGAGSRKVRFAKETETRMHGHPEVPSPLAADAKIWIEIEGAGKGSLAPKR
jgi:hypothetical protein